MNEFKEKVENFHSVCDNKRCILMICKSKNEIFGGYTPLSFNSLNEYGYDNESFLFSLNKLENILKILFQKQNQYGVIKIMVHLFIMIYTLKKVK